MNKNLVEAAHDISSGGLILALSEMSMDQKLVLKLRNPKVKKFN